MKNNNCLAASAVCLLTTPAVLWAQTTAAGHDEPKEVVVTASRSADGVRADLLGASFTVIEPVDLEHRQTRIVSDVLRDVPGLAVSRTGAVGGLTQVRIRGAEGNHTLVLIDGIKASDPYQDEFDFATLIADEVARVEVLRGQQSALYGSDAIGGLISYTTLTGREAPGLRARLEGGSFGTVDTALRFGGVAGAFDYALSAGYQTTDGTPTSRFGTRDVGSSNKVASGKFTYAPTDEFRVKAVLRYSRTQADNNDQDFLTCPSATCGFVVDTDGFYNNRAGYGLVRAELDSLDGRWSHALQAQGVNAHREGFLDQALSNGDAGSRGRYSYESTLRFGTETAPQSVTAAFDYERDKYQNRGPFLTGDQGLEQQTINKGVVLQYDLTANDRIGFGAALRHDRNDRFDNDTTYRLQGSYRFESNTRLHAAAGTGVKSPGFFEMFGFDPSSFIGNPDLKPEKSRGWEAGVEQRFAGERASVDVTYFDNTLEDEIFTDFSVFPFTAGNRTTESTQKGVEVAVRARPTSQWNIEGSYTYLDAKENGVEEVRRPPHIASLNVDWRTPADEGGVALTVRYNGETLDNDFRTFDSARVKLQSYTLVNLGGDWSITETVQLYGRVENLFDEDYEEVFTYRTPGRAEYVGVRVRF